MPKTLIELMDLKKKLATNVNIDETEVKISQDCMFIQAQCCTDE